MYLAPAHAERLRRALGAALVVLRTLAGDVRVPEARDVPQPAGLAASMAGNSLLLGTVQFYWTICEFCTLKLHCPEHFLSRVCLGFCLQR